MRAALIRSNVVENVIIVGADYTPPGGLTLRVLDNEVVSPGDTVNQDGSFTRTPAIPPHPDDTRLDELAVKAESANLTTGEVVEAVRLALRRRRL